MKYDKEERDILNALKNGEMKLATPSKKEIESIKAAANNTLPEREPQPFLRLTSDER